MERVRKARKVEVEAISPSVLSLVREREMFLAGVKFGYAQWRPASTEAQAIREAARYFDQQLARRPEGEGEGGKETENVT